MDIIKSSAEITQLFTKGRRVRTSNVTLLVLEQRDCSTSGGGRVAFIAGKKLGNSVWRNRARRRMRAACAELNGPWTGYDIGFMAQQRINDNSYADLIRDIRYALSKSGIIKE